MRTPFSAFIALTVLSVSSLVGLTSAPAQAACQKTPDPGVPTIPGIPWHLDHFKLGTLPYGLTGKNVKVAVLDSGVDAINPSMRGQVDESLDTLHNVPGHEDCFGHGTAVAGIIAAADRKGSNYRGIAPGARILSARVSENAKENENQQPAPPENMARAVDWAVEQGARVINMSFTYKSDTGLEKFKASVQNAIAKGVVVVAAVGNHNTEGNPIPYPAAWPGVVGVAAIAQEGSQKLEQSQVGKFVDIAAPGVKIWAPRPGNGFVDAHDGTSFAAPMVAATAALILERFPNLTGEQVVKRLMATSDPAPGGRMSKTYGAGIVNPVRAVTELLDEAAPRPGTALRSNTDDAAAAAAAQRLAERQRQALWIGALVLLGVIVSVALMTALPAGGRRRWRAAGR